jgi:hypothetical protein
MDRDRIEALSAAIGALGDSDPNTRAILLVRLAVEKLYESDRTERLALADEALATARASNDSLTLANVLSSRHNVILSHDSIEQRRSDNVELRALADDLGDPNLRFYARVGAFFWRYQARDLAGARVSAHEAAELGRALSQPQFEWVGAWLHAALARLDGDLDASGELVEHALAVGSEGGVPDAAFFRAVQSVGLLEDRGDRAALDEARSLCAEMPAHYPALRLNAALLEAAVGEIAPARAARRELGASSFAPWSESGGTPDSALSYAALFVLAEAALGESSAWTRAAYEYLEPWPGQLYGNIIIGGPVEISLAASAPLVGRGDDVDGLLDTGLAQCEEMSSPLLSMYARLHGACGLCLRGRGTDRDRAAKLLDEAVALGDRMGAGIARAAAESWPALLA